MSKPHWLISKKIKSSAVHNTKMRHVKINAQKLVYSGATPKHGQEEALGAQLWVQLTISNTIK
jgi:hypothetical protein